MSAVRLALATLALFLVGMSTVSAAPQAATSSVTIQNFAFVPQTVTINAGDSVRWTNTDSGVSHTSTSNTPGVWDSGALAQNVSFSHVFNSAGTFAYHCNIHPTMTGTVVVQSVATPAPTLVPTPQPTPVATPVPTPRPTVAPTPQPTDAPTASPTPAPAASPSPSPTVAPVIAPAATTNAPAAAASSAPTVAPAPVATSDSGPGPLLVVIGAVVVVGLVGLAFARSRR